MHPALSQELAKAKITEMHRNATKARLARAARLSCRAQTPRRQPVTSNPARALLYRLLTAVSARTI